MTISSRRDFRFGRQRAVPGLLLVPATVLVVIGCAGAGSSPTAVRVGGASIDRDTVEHWSAAIARGAIVAPVVSASQSFKEQALTLLITADWLNGEASRAGLRPSHRQLAHMIEQQERSAPSGPREFKEILANSGQTFADVEFEARARWAASALARRLASAATRQARAQVTSGAVARFYRLHAARYHLRERRYYDLIERLPSRAAAAALAKRLGTGPRFHERASWEEPFRPRTFAGLPGQTVVYRAVFAAKIGVLTGPLPLQGAYALFVIRRIDPPRVQPLSEVHDSIEHRLLTTAERRARAQLVEQFRRRWVARTDCHGGYVVQKCRQYVGAGAPEHDPFVGY